MIEGFRNGEKDSVELRNLFSKDVGDLDENVGKLVWLEPVAILLMLGGMGVVFSQGLYVLPAFWALAGAAVLAAVVSMITERKSRVFLRRTCDEMVEALQAGEKSV